MWKGGSSKSIVQSPDNVLLIQLLKKTYYTSRISP
jgi:hypothetical protein